MIDDGVDVEDGMPRATRNVEHSKRMVVGGGRCTQEAQLEVTLNERRSVHGVHITKLETPILCNIGKIEVNEKNACAHIYCTIKAAIDDIAWHSRIVPVVKVVLDMDEKSNCNYWIVEGLLGRE